MRSPSVTIALLTLLLLLPRVASADDEVDARTHFATGKTAYEAHDYTTALDQFKESYRLSRRSPLLYNIGVCQERLGQNDAAITTYELYLKEMPDGEEREHVRARIAFLRTVTPQPAPRAEPVPTAPVVVTHTDVVATPVPPRRSRRGLAIGLAIGGVVVVGLAVGLGVGLTVGRSSDAYTPSTLGAHPGSL